jgi:mannose-1-phosphate guanylyltransferase
MVARVPFKPRLDLECEAPHSRLWTIVLTGDAPPRVGHGPRGHRCRPAARWPASGTRVSSRAQRTLERASHLAPADQMITVLTRRQMPAWESELAAVDGTRRVVQPSYRGRAAEMLLPLLMIARREPSATVVVLPADQRVDHDARFLRYVARAVWAVALRPEVPILIGAHPSAPVVDGWIEPGAPLEGLEALAVRAVKCFVDDASPAERRRLFDASALTSTAIFVGRAGTLLALAERTLGDVLEALEPLAGVFGRPEEPLLCEAVYECMPRAGLAAFERSPELAVLALPDVVWHAPEPEALQLAS